MDVSEIVPREGHSRLAAGILTAFLLGLYCVLLQHVRSMRVSYHRHNTTTSPGKQLIPFVYVASADSKGIDRAIQSSLAQFRNEASHAVQGMSRALEKALELELELDINLSIPKASRLSTKLKNRIQAMASCLEADENILDSLLLSGFQPTLALPDDSVSFERKKTRTDDCTSKKSSFKSTSSASELPFILPVPQLKRSGQVNGDDNAYDAAGQIVAHLVRDWTVLGAKVRRSLYDWCIEQVLPYRYGRGPVLIPGAGMGRLAYSLYQLGFTVEANELSPVMAAAAQAILQKGASGFVHPFLLDRLSNEVDSQRRFDAVQFPDVPIQFASAKGALSFTIGDFSLYRSRETLFQAVITCFFLDTAENIYEYLDLIRRLLKPGGTWINVGPLQWHRNAMTFPAADELRELVAAFDFKVVKWEVDQSPMAYRDQVDGATSVRATNFDGYRPLRFVAIRK